MSNHDAPDVPVSKTRGRDLQRRLMQETLRCDLSDVAEGALRRTEHASWVDAWLQELFEHAIAQVGGGAKARGAVALAAVGSLGRCDLGPASDLDLILLHDGKALSEAEIAALCDHLWYPIWDANLALDQATRTPQGCIATAKSDISAAVAMLDLRLIAGEPSLVEQARAGVHATWRTQARTNIDRLLDSLTQRASSVGDAAYLSEPDIKSSQGGLRDAVNVKALTATWLADRPHGELDAAHAFLLNVRDALHVATGRNSTRLLRVDYDVVAAACGYEDADDLLALISGAARTITFALEVTVRRARQANPARPQRSLGFGVLRRPKLMDVGFGLIEHDGEISCGPTLVGSREPLLGLRAAATAASLGIPLSTATLHTIAQLPQLPVPWPAEARERFFEILGAGAGQVAVWEALDQVGVLTRWFPEWEGIRNRPQRSAIHRFTVDRHSIEAVVQASELVRRVERPDVLLFAALVHDIGKRRGQRDHSREGVPFARAMAERIGLPPEDVHSIEILVREHLTLAETATRRDPGDPGTIRTIIAAVEGRLDVLNLLRQLTEADARAASPQAWTAWRARLIDVLTARVEQSLHRGGFGATEEAHESEDPLMHLDAGELTLLRAAQASGDVEVHVAAVTQGGDRTDDVTGRRVPLQHGLFCISMAVPNRPGVFAAMAESLAVSRLTVKSALIRTLEETAIDTWWVESPYGPPDAKQLAQLLRRHLASETPPAPEPSGLKMNQPGSAAPAVTAIAEASARATVIQVRAADRKGLLTDIAQVLVRLNLDIRSAHASTLAGQAVDVLYVTEVDGSRLQPARVAELISALMHAAA